MRGIVSVPDALESRTTDDQNSNLSPVVESNRVLQHIQGVNRTSHLTEPGQLLTRSGHAPHNLLRYGTILDQRYARVWFSA
jgi:hypothetical protein